MYKKGKAIVVFGKDEGKLIYFNIFSYPKKKQQAQSEFIKLINICDERYIMTIDRLSEILNYINESDIVTNQAGERSNLDASQSKSNKRDTGILPD